MDFPLLLDGQQFSDHGSVLASTNGTTLTAAGVAHTKGAYTQLVASTPSAATGLLVQFAVGGAAAAASYLVDIAVGAAAAEQVVIPNILVDSANNAGLENGVVWFPIAIPAGSRIAARQQASATARTIAISVILLGAGLVGVPVGGRCADLGTVTSGDTNGTVYDPGGVAHTKGGYLQLSSGTPHDIRALILAIGSNRNTILTTARWFIDLAIGAAAAEQVLIPNLLVTAFNSNNILPYFIGPFPCAIPAGTRLSINAQCTIIDATDRKFAFAAYGIG